MNSINIGKSEQTKETITHNEDNSFSQKVENIINGGNKTENIEILYNILSSKLSEKLEDLLRIEYYNGIDTNLIISGVINSFKINKNEIINNILATIEVTKNMNLSIDFEKIIITAIDEIINEQYKDILYNKYVEFYEKWKQDSIELYQLKKSYTRSSIINRDNFFKKIGSRDNRRKYFLEILKGNISLGDIIEEIKTNNRFEITGITIDCRITVLGTDKKNTTITFNSKYYKKVS